uniref:hypothetical protein n=1 Tax=uncultured Sphingomonas sp. TaxID=158754 RepID=UPI0025CBD2B4|nr:hypothetical protein [uncultured Sphingomonas sp.]
MFRGFRLSILLLAGALITSAGAPASAQNNVVAPPPPPREGTVGPEQLRDFSLGGSRSQQPEGAREPSAEQGTPVGNPDRPAAAPAPAPRTVVPPPTSRVEQAAGGARPSASPAPSPAPSSEAAPATSLNLPPPTPAPSASFDFNSPGFGNSAGGAVDPIAPAPVSDEGGAPMWPWLLAFAAVVAGALLLWSRRRSKGEDQLDSGGLAFAGGASPSAEPRREPQPAAPRASVPAPQPAPAPAPSHPKGVGIVSTRLRPWLDLDVHVTAAVLTEEELQLHLQLLVANSGSVPARQVGVEVAPLNAGPEQEGELATFFARPDPAPQAAEMIAPLDHAALQAVVRMPRAAFREYAAGEGRVLVPLVAVNVGYRAGSSTGRTSGAFLIGRGSGSSEKLGPLRTDPGPREFRGVIARALPGGVRR